MESGLASPLGPPPSLPSLSTLTGAIRPSTAQQYVEASFRDFKKASERLLLRQQDKLAHEAEMGKAAKKQSPGQVHNLLDAASRHINTLERKPSSPYPRTLTPSERQALEQEVAAKLRQFASSLSQNQNQNQQHEQQQQQQQQQPGHSEPPLMAAAAPGLRDGGSLAGPSGALPLSRPGTSVSVKDMVFHRPTSRLMRLRGVANWPLSSSWSGPLTPWLQNQSTPCGGDGGPGPGPGGSHLPLSKPGTPLRASSLRQSMPSLRPCTAPQDADGWPQSPSGQQGGARAMGRPPGTAQSYTYGDSRPCTSGGPVMGGGRTAYNPATGKQPTTGVANLNHGTAGGGRLEMFKVSRGMVYSVFSELDPTDSGVMTFSTFEDAALMIGMKADQAKQMFQMLDTEKRGFFTIRNWGSSQLEKQITNFTRLYIQKTRGASGRHKDVRLIKSAPMALQMAMTKLQLKNNGRSVSTDRLLEAFSFIDLDHSGSLDRHEVEDAFSAMGIYVTPEVVDSMMASFDKDGSGSIDYSEFIGTLYPTLAKGLASVRA